MAQSLSQPVVLKSTAGTVRTYSPVVGLTDVVDAAQDGQPTRTLSTRGALSGIESRVRAGWSVESAGPELTRLRRNYRAGVSRRARDEAMDSIGMVKVRSDSGRTYYE